MSLVCLRSRSTSAALPCAPPDFDVNVIDDVNHGVNHDVGHFAGDGEMINGIDHVNHGVNHDVVHFAGNGEMINGMAGQILENTNQHRDIRVKKPTILLTNLKGLGATLGRRCDGQHLHSYVIGNVKVQDRWIKRSNAAGVYPAALCKCMAQAVNREC